MGKSSCQIRCCDVEGRSLWAWRSAHDRSGQSCFTRAPPHCAASHALSQHCLCPVPHAGVLRVRCCSYTAPTAMLAPLHTPLSFCLWRRSYASARPQRRRSATKIPTETAADDGPNAVEAAAAAGGALRARWTLRCDARPALPGTWAPAGPARLVNPESCQKRSKGVHILSPLLRNPPCRYSRLPRALRASSPPVLPPLPLLPPPHTVARVTPLLPGLGRSDGTAGRGLVASGDGMGPAGGGGGAGVGLPPRRRRNRTQGTRICTHPLAPADPHPRSRTRTHARARRTCGAAARRAGPCSRRRTTLQRTLEHARTHARDARAQTHAHARGRT